MDLGSTIILAAELYYELSFLISKIWESRDMIYFAPFGAKMYTVLGRIKENCLNQMIMVTSDVFSEDAAKGLKICLIDLEIVRAYIYFLKYIKIIYIYISSVSHHIL